MEIPRFVTGSFDTRIAGPDPGEAFQVFSGEVLSRRYPQLHLYQARGRDGGIDFDTAGGVVGECKHCGTDDVQRAWNEVAARFEKHLAEPAGPGQSQYGPWYVSGDEAITGYVFATSAEFPNKDRKDELRNEIRAFFVGLSAKPHLQHLGALNVEVLDWSDFKAELKTRPPLVFRWFPSMRPNGLTPLDAVQDGRFFRSFLSESTLPYYSRATHLKTTTDSASLAPAEDDLLRKLDGVTGLIITGKGGVGKTRLTLELGRRAKEEGWLVMRAASSFSDAAVDELLTRLVDATDVLLLIDYVETIATFADRVEHVEMLNATTTHRIRYISNCRTSYYRNVQTIGGHERVDVTPVASGSADWLDGYRRAVVEKVLTESGIEPTPTHLQICRDIPVFAVFMAYLQREGRAGDLHELVADGEFGTWIARRVQQSFGRPIASDLTKLLAVFPMDETRRAALPLEMRELVERLAADGWIEQLLDGPDAGQWVTAHDALADRVILNHLENLGQALGAFVRDLLDFAEINDGIAPTLIALQRLSDSAVLQTLDWVSLFAERLRGGESGWLSARLLILQNNLLSASQRLGLLQATRWRWDDLIGDITFQNTLGWLCKQFTDTDSPASDQRNDLRSWVVRSAAQINRSNYLLTRGLILFPDLQPDAERWLASHPLEFQTHYLLTAWLAREHGTAAVMRYVGPWIEKFVTAPQGSFVIRAWLNAGGDGTLIEEPIRKWLEHHSNSEAAPFVYRGWLDAGGDRTLVEKSIRKWLEHHSDSEGATFVYQAWLDAGGDRELVEDRILEWLEQRSDSERARFVYQAWLEAGGDRELVEDRISKWLRHHSESAGANFLYRAWLNADGDRALVEEPIRKWLAHHSESGEAQFVYGAWLDASGDRALVGEPIRKWLEQHSESEHANFVYRAWLDAGGDRTLVEEPIRKWLRQHSESQHAHSLYRAWLDAGGDRTLVKEPIRKWLEQHSESEHANYLYRAWLDAGGDRVLVEEPIRKWLDQHGESVEADFVYRAWLDSGGDRVVVENQVIAWLQRHAHTDGTDFLVVSYLQRGGDLEGVRESAMSVMSRLRDHPDGAFIADALARQSELPDEAILDVVMWCRRYSDREDALWRLSRLGDKIARSAIAAEACAAAEAILSRWLDPASAPSAKIATLITDVLATIPTCRDWRLRERAYAMLVRWLRHPTGIETAGVFRVDVVRRIINFTGVLLRRDLIDLDADAAALARLTRWAELRAPEALGSFGALPEWFAERAAGVPND